jgi:Uma2 family endonuclease
MRDRATSAKVFVSGPKVEIAAQAAFEPDVVVICGEVPEGLLVPGPLIVVEVLSSSTRDRDLTVKLADYASLPSVPHCLLIETRAAPRRTPSSRAMTNSAAPSFAPVACISPHRASPSTSM